MTRLVHQGHPGRQQRDQQRPADDHVDIEQPAPQDRDRHRHRDGEQHEERGDGVRHLLQRLVGLAERDGQAADSLAGQHPGDGQRQPLHLLAQPLVAAAVPERQRDQRAGQQHREHRGQAVQGAEPGDRPEGRERERVGIGQRDAARRGQRHRPRADHERGQGQAGQHQAGQGGWAPPGRGQPPGREDQEERGQVDGHEHEDRLGQRPDRGRRRERSGVRLHAEDRVDRAGDHDGGGGPLGQHEPSHEVARSAHDQRAERRVGDRPGHGADTADRVGRGQGAPLQRGQHEPGQRH
jgi:hypothetical protein